MGLERYKTDPDCTFCCLYCKLICNIVEFYKNPQHHDGDDAKFSDALVAKMLRLIGNNMSVPKRGLLVVCSIVHQIRHEI